VASQKAIYLTQRQQVTTEREQEGKKIMHYMTTREEGKDSMGNEKKENVSEKEESFSPNTRNSERFPGKKSLDSAF